MESRQFYEFSRILTMVAPDFRIMSPSVTTLRLDGEELESLKFSIPGDRSDSYCFCYLEEGTWFFGRVQNDDLESTELHSSHNMAALKLVYSIGNAICDVVQSGESPSLPSATVSYLFALETIKSHTSMFGGRGAEFRRVAKQLHGQLDDRRLMF